MVWNNKWLWALSLFVLFSGVFYLMKKNDPQESDTTTEVPAYETEEFTSFYTRFGEDRVFQLEHIPFPLEGMPAAKDSMPPAPESFRWGREEWVVHKPYNDMDGTFTRQFMSVGDIVTEIIADKSNRFSMERRFAKIGGEWHLIYYREMGIY